MNPAVVIAPDPSGMSGPPASGAPPGAPPDAQPFQGALEDQLARTAAAEGHEGEDRSIGERSHHGDASADAQAEAGIAAVQPSAAAPADAAAEASAGLTPASTLAAPSATAAPAPDPQAVLVPAPTREAPVPAGPGAGSDTSSRTAADDAPAPSPSAPPAADQGRALDVAAKPDDAGNEDASAGRPALATTEPGPTAPTPLDPAAQAASPAMQLPQPGQPAAGPAAEASGQEPGEQQERSEEAPAGPRSGAVPAPVHGAPGVTEGGPARVTGTTTVTENGPARVTGTTIVTEHGPARLPGDASPVATTYTAPDASAQQPVGQVAQAGARPLAGPAGLSGATAGHATVTEAPSPATPPAAPPDAAPASPEGPLLGSGVAMQEMIESIRATVELGARAGLAQARIALHPEELGQIKIHLTQTRDGLLARVSADEPVAIRALLAGRSELAHALKGLAGSVSLDIGSSAHRHMRGEAGRSDAAERPRRVAAAGTPAEEAEALSQAQSAAPLQTPKGALVDVLA